MIQLTEKQQEIIDSPARVKLVMGGMRSGKTLLAIMAAWDMMIKSTSYPRMLFLIPGDRYQRNTVEEIKNALLESIMSISKEQVPDGKFFTLIRTDYGDIFVSDNFICDSFEGIVFDNATSNKHLAPGILDRNEKLYFTGHCPDDMNNTFFLMWLKAYFSDNSDEKAFHLNTWNNPAMLDKKNEHEENLRERMGKHRYNRSYLCIPDFLDNIEPKANDWLRHEHEGRFTERNERIEFDKHYLGKW